MSNTNTPPPLYSLTPIDQTEGLEEGKWYIVKTTGGDTREMLFDEKEWHGDHEPYEYLRPLPEGTVVVNEYLISNLPHNMPLYKDSGLWQLRSDDMEEIVLQQKINETFIEFIYRCADYSLTKLAQMGE